MTDARRADVLVAAYRDLDPAALDLDVWDTPAARTAVLARIPIASASDPAITTPVSHRRRPPRRRRFAAITFGAVATACAALLVVGAVDLPGDVTTARPASAAEVLTAAAHVAETASPLPPLTGDQRVYDAFQLDEAYYTSGRFRNVYEEWVDQTNRKVIRTTRLNHPDGSGGDDGNEDVTLDASDEGTRGEVPATADALAAVPTTPDEFRAFIERTRHATAPDASSPTNERVRTALVVLTRAFAPPALRAAAFDYLATFPGARNEGTVIDAFGRPGTSIAVDLPDPVDASTTGSATLRFVIDPATSSLLEMRRIQPLELARQTLTRALGPSAPEPTLEQRTVVVTYVPPVVVDGARVRPADVTVVGDRFTVLSALSQSGASTTP